MKRYLIVGMVNVVLFNVVPRWNWDWMALVFFGIVAGAIVGGKHQAFTSTCLMVAPVEIALRLQRIDPIGLPMSWGIYFALAKLGAWGRMAVSRQGRPARSF